MKARGARRVARVAFGLAVLWAAVFVPVPEARADAASSRARAVEVVVRGEAESAAALTETIRELLGRQDVAVVRAGDEGAPLAKVRVELPPRGTAIVEVVSGRGGDRVVLHRTFDVDEGGTIAREAIAHVVLEAVEAELLEAPLPTETAPPPAPPPPPVRIEPPPRRTPEADRAPAGGGAPFVLDVGTFGGIGPVASGSGPVPRVGAGVTVGIASRFRPALSALVSGAFPFERANEIVGARTSMISARLLPSVELARSTSFTLDVALGGGVDVISVTPISDRLPPAAMGADTSRVSAVGTGLVATRIDVVPRVVFVVAAGVDVDPVRRTYVVARGPEAETLVSPFAVRPTLLLGLAFTAVGPAPFAEAP